MRITKAVSSSEFDWFTSCRAIDAMVIFNTPFWGQQELSIIGAEQTTSSLVVMILETTGSAGGGTSLISFSFKDRAERVVNQKSSKLVQARYKAQVPVYGRRKLMQKKEYS